jgi:hypothetical protein
MKLIIAKEIVGALAAFTGGSVALFFEFYTAFGFCGFVFLWSLISLVFCFIESRRKLQQELLKPEISSDVAANDLPDIKTENRIILLNCGINFYGATGFQDDCEMDTNSPVNGVNTVIFLKPDTNLCND